MLNQVFPLPYSLRVEHKDRRRSRIALRRGPTKYYAVSYGSGSATIISKEQVLEQIIYLG
jgi:hypothetical protein